MTILTHELLIGNGLIHKTDRSSYLRGEVYYRQGRATLLEFTGEAAFYEVEGEYDDYDVTIWLAMDKTLLVNCTCPHAPRVPICKHGIAAILDLAAQLQKGVGATWRYNLQKAIETSQAVVKPVKRTFVIAFFELHAEQYWQKESFHLRPCVVRSSDWHDMKVMVELPDVATRQAFLAENLGWMSEVTIPRRPLDVDTCINLSNEAVQVFNFLLRLLAESPYVMQENIGEHISLAQSMGISLFIRDEKFQRKLLPLELAANAVNLEAILVQHEKNLTIEAGFRVNDEAFSTLNERIRIVSQAPAWIMVNRRLMRVNNPEAFALMAQFPIEIPAEEEEEFRREYFPVLAHLLPVNGDIVQSEEIRVQPVARLYLRDDVGVLQAELRFAYENLEFGYDPKADVCLTYSEPDSWNIMRFYRDIEKEQTYHQMLTDARYGLKRAGKELGAQWFELRAKVHPFDFLLNSIPLLVAAGFEIYGEEKLRVGKINRAVPKISLGISSGIDWFDLDTQITYGDQKVSFGDMRRALIKNERFIKLADGSIGQIPDEWLRRYKRLFEMVQYNEKGMRVKSYHLPLVDTLLEEAEIDTNVDEFRQRYEQLSNFSGIQKQDIPEGFHGELRPYQKAGLEWLHFLHDYNFGGCLADDMGLGKTVQVLVFLQSLIEQKKVQAASLLVVPKSLLANWQRESANFTPQLRFLEHFGNTRLKDCSNFADYDLVLTTYGTLLRDIETLKDYNFHYVILDESQAIKNPMAQVTKATRLLQTDHRLVMTGTPVENNTFELWSQFAFINPGLLGNLEYFKREFSTPIESKKDEEAATVLKKLVFPFILRRTKKQVAPELPPRTERILFTEMDAAQKKIYDNTREHYRQVLSGMIDEQGMENARMKILEGLLRLRQVCIHPALVQAGYRGEAAKFELLMDTLDTLKSENHKALIFSQFVEVLHLVRNQLDEKKIPYAYLDGQTRKRQDAVDRFQNDEQTPFFLISLKAGGFGLNLTAADYVIILDPWWNPAVELQASDRAHRIGQDKPVFVYKIIVRDTVEEKILQLQQRKKDLVDQLVNAEGSFFKQMTAEDVQGLFG